MNKEKEIEEMTRAVMCAMEYREKIGTPNFELIVQNLINAGYGNVKQAVKDVLDEVSKHYGGSWLVELYKKYDLEVDK